MVKWCHHLACFRNHCSKDVPQSPLWRMEKYVKMKHVWKCLKHIFETPSNHPQPGLVDDQQKKNKISSPTTVEFDSTRPCLWWLLLASVPRTNWAVETFLLALELPAALSEWWASKGHTSSAIVRPKPLGPWPNVDFGLRVGPRHPGTPRCQSSKRMMRWSQLISTYHQHLPSGLQKSILKIVIKHTFLLKNVILNIHV